MFADLASILFDGLAYAMVLFIVSVGLSVTLGLMNLVNLAHGALAMLGGYAVVSLCGRFGWPFLAGLIGAFVLVGLLSLILERLIFRRLYGAPELDQVAVGIGLILIAGAAVIVFYGPSPQTLVLPDYLKGRFTLGGMELPVYRSVLIVLGFLVFGMLWIGIERTRLGARIRAAVDNRRMARSLGIDVDRLFALVFALGGGLSALGGGLAIEIVGMGPSFAIQYLVLFLIVVAVGGMGSVRGTFLAALVLGVVDTAGKYYFPAGGGFFIYGLTVILLIWRPEGLLGRKLSGQAAASAGSLAARKAAPLALRHRGRWPEALPWLAMAAAFAFLPGHLAFGVQMMVLLLFVLSLDLVLGFAGVVTLGHAAFFGIGAYTVGLLALRVGWHEPLTGLLAAGGAAAAVGWAAGWFLLRYHGLTLLMLTLATAMLLHEAANSAAALTGGYDGLNNIVMAPLLGVFENDLWARSYFVYAGLVLLLGFLAARHVIHSAFGLSLVGIRENSRRMIALGADVHRRLVTVFVISAGMAGVAGGLFAQFNAYITLDVLSFPRSGFAVVMLVLGGTGRLYGAFVGGAVYLILEDVLAKASPQYWQLGVGLVLVAVVLAGRGGLLGLWDRWREKS